VSCYECDRELYCAVADTCRCALRCDHLDQCSKDLKIGGYFVSLQVCREFQSYVQTKVLSSPGDGKEARGGGSPTVVGADVDDPVAADNGSVHNFDLTVASVVPDGAAGAWTGSSAVMTSDSGKRKRVGAAAAAAAAKKGNAGTPSRGRGRPKGTPNKRRRAQSAETTPSASSISVSDTDSAYDDDDSPVLSDSEDGDDFDVHDPSVARVVSVAKASGGAARATGRGRRASRGREAAVASVVVTASVFRPEAASLPNSLAGISEAAVINQITVPIVITPVSDSAAAMAVSAAPAIAAPAAASYSEHASPSNPAVDTESSSAVLPPGVIQATTASQLVAISANNVGARIGDGAAAAKTQAKPAADVGDKMQTDESDAVSDLDDDDDLGD